MKKILTVLVMLVVLGIIGWGGYQYLNKRAISFVTIDINPLVELAVNSNNVVVDALPLNEDADLLLSDLDLIGMDVEKAGELIVSEATRMGFIDELSDTNTVVITSSAEKEDVRENLEKKIIDRLNTYFETTKTYALVVARGLDEELKKEAESYGVTYGKMLLVESALSFDTTLNKDELIEMSIQSIQKTIKEYVKRRHADMKLTREEAKTLWQKQKEQSIEQFKMDQRALKETLWNEVKDQYKNATSLEKEDIIRNLVIIRKEQIKTSLDELKDELQQERDQILEELKETRKNYNYPVIENRYERAKEIIQERRNKN